MDVAGAAALAEAGDDQGLVRAAGHYADVKTHYLISTIGFSIILVITNEMAKHYNLSITQSTTMYLPMSSD